MKNNEYHPFAKFLHWSIVVIIGIQFLSAFLMPGLRYVTASNFYLNSHFSFGILILPLALLLLFMRFYRPVAKSETINPDLAEKAAIGMQHMLYLLLLLIPFTGWALASSRGASVSFFGLINLPELFAKGSTLGYTMGRSHSLLAAGIGLLAAGHAGAALYHHIVLKDSVLKRILPKFLQEKF